MVIDVRYAPQYNGSVHGVNLSIEHYKTIYVLNRKPLKSVLGKVRTLQSNQLSSFLSLSKKCPLKHSL